MHKKINFNLYPTRSTKALARVDIPASDSDDPFPLGPDPKEWTGPWKSITDPSTIARHVCAANHRQYSQAQDTPLGKDPLLSALGYRADTPTSNEIVYKGILPADILHNQLPETKALLQTLANINSSRFTEVTIDITPEQFQAIYSLLPESTSSSPSGRYIGHYKVAAKSDTLSGLLSKMMSIPLLGGFSPTGWRTVVDVMLEKSAGDPKIHRLRIIALQESDFNQCNRLTISRLLMYKLEDMGLIPKMQYGSRPKKLCHSAILNKQLTFKIGNCSLHRK
jgi:hypothetical protein